MHTASARQTPRTSFSRHRGDGIEFQRLLTGTPGSRNAFELSIIHISEGYGTPRHHHNFDQLRLCLRGSFNYARGQDIEAGDVLYVPEGTWYGPHRNQGEAELMLIQYGGNTGCGFLTYEELADGYRRLSAMGQFENGIFRPASGGAPASRNQDGYEAIWEAVRGAPVVYPPPRYSEPILIRPAAFDWLRVTDAPGAEEKNLGVFGERRNQVRMLRIAPGSTVTVGGVGCHELLFVVGGAVRIGEEQLAERDAFSMAPDDRPVPVTATEHSELFWTSLPDFSEA